MRFGVLKFAMPSKSPFKHHRFPRKIILCALRWYWRYIGRKLRNYRIESDHAAMKRLFGRRQSFRFLRTANATLSGIETIRTIKRGHLFHRQPGVRGEITFIHKLFESAA